MSEVSSENYVSEAEILSMKNINLIVTLKIPNLRIMGGTKRKHGGDSTNEVYSNKSRSRPSVEARVDPTYGQRSALPGLDDESNPDGEDDGLDYGEEMDAISYLRSVR